MSTPTKPILPGYLLLALSLLSWAGCLAIASDRLLGLLINSSLLAGGALLISLPLGTLLAVAISKTSLLGRQILEHCLVAMLFIPLYVQAAAWQAVAGQTTAGQGGWLIADQWLTGWRGAIWVHGVAAIPWVVLIVTARLRKVPRELEEESLLDVADWRVLVRVSMPHAVAGMIAASLWVTVICFSEIAVTDLFQVRTFAEEVYTAASLGTLDGVVVPPAAIGVDLADVPKFAADELWLGTLAVILLVAAALAAISIWVPIANFVSPDTNWRWQLRRGGQSLAILVWLTAAAVLGAPLLGLVSKAGAIVERNDGQIVQSWSAVKTVTLVARSPWEHRREFSWSLLIACSATIASVAIAIVLAWGLRTGRLPKLPTALALSLGFAIPGPLLGVGIIHCLNQPPDSLFSGLTWFYDHTILAPVIAQFLRALPLVALILTAQFASLPQDILDSAQSDGAGWWRQLLSVALPWSWPTVVAAACMGLIVSIGDLAATLLVVPPGVSPLSVRIFGLLHYGAEDRVSALCLMMVLLLGVVAASAWQLQQLIQRRLNRED